MVIGQKINKNNLIKACFYCFPFLLISGPFLPDLLITFLSIFFLVYFVSIKNLYLNKNKIILIFFFFYIYININSLFSFVPDISLNTTIPYIRMIFFAIFLSYLIEKISGLKKVIFFSFLYSYIILFLDSLIQINTGHGILGNPIINDRISSLFREKLVMGSYVIRTLPIIIAISFIEKFKNEDFLRIIIFVIAGALVFFSAERVSFFFYLVFLSIYLILLPKKKFFISFFLILVSFLIIIYIKPSSIKRLYYHSLNQINNNNFYYFSERHEMHFVTAFRIFLDKKILGHGVKSFRYLCDKPPFEVTDVIINNNKNLAPFDGYAYFLDNYSIDKYKKVFFSDKLLSNDLLNIFHLNNKSKDGLDKLVKDNYIKQLNSLKQNKKVRVYNVKILLTPFEQGEFIRKGENIFSSSDYKNGCNTHPHNAHIQVLSELGIVGYLFVFSFFLYLLLSFLKTMIKQFTSKKDINEYKNQNIYLIFILASLIQSLFPLLPSGNIFNNWISIFLYFKLAFLFNYIYFHKKL